MATNNIYHELADKVVKRYAKVPLHIISGVRVDPHNQNAKVVWILKTELENYDFKTKKTNFVYEDEVIELYSQFEADAFVRLNASLFKNGLIKEYHGKQDEVDLSNAIDDTELLRIANLKTISDFESSLEKFSSQLTLERLKQIAIQAGKSVKRIQLIDARIEALNDDS